MKSCPLAPVSTMAVLCVEWGSGLREEEVSIASKLCYHTTLPPSLSGSAWFVDIAATHCVLR